MRKMILVILMLAMAFQLAACGTGGAQDAGETQPEPSAQHTGDDSNVPLGDFSAVDFQGNTVTKEIFADYDLTMVNLWTTTCGYCMEEMPDLNALRKEFQEEGIRFNIISFCMDLGSAGQVDEAKLEKAKQIVEKTGVEYPNLIPDSVLLEGRLKDIQAFPESFFVDSSGNVVSRAYVGSMPKNHWRVTIKDEIEQMTQRQEED